MALSRRQLLLRSAGLTAAWLGGRRLRESQAAPAGPGEMAHGKMAMPRPIIKRQIHALSMPRFVDPLRIPPVIKPAGTQPDPAHAGRSVPLYRVRMREVEVRVHRDVPPTRCWGYGDSMPGPTFDVRAGEPIAVEWKNELPAKHFLPIDHTLCGADASLPEVRTAVHVHGGRVPPESDGYPDQWFTPGNARLTHYPNRQDAATLWYHDHAMGIERLNQYAGLFGAYLLRDKVEDGLGLPSGPYEIPLFIFDRFIGEDGALLYPTSGSDETPWVSEVYSEAILVNGVLAPDLEVERRAYRFRIVNSSNARFLLLSLSNNAPLTQIGSDQGLLAQPVQLPRVSLAPAERADIVIDFSSFGGQSIVLKNQAFELMRFRVKSGAAAPAWQPPAVLREVTRTPRASAVKTRTLTLREYPEPTHGMLMLLNDAHWRDPVTEKPVLDSTEIWELVNYTEDTHPIHLHLVRFQVLERQLFDLDTFIYKRKFQLLGPPMPPDPGEAGWKDTVQAHTAAVTRIIVRFEGYVGRYVWHCHVLEHAANEMMRPFEIVKSSARR